MRAQRILIICSAALVAGSVPALAGAGSILEQAYDLSADRSSEVQYFVMTSKLMSYALDGTRLGADTMRLRLKCVPTTVGGRKVDQYTCTDFTIEFADGSEVSVAAVRNWTYDFKHTVTGMNEKGEVLGIDHSRFENLTDTDGKPIRADKAYHVYNAFIDFHAFCDVFARPISGGGKGIQDLKRLGDRIVHAAAGSEPPVNLGSNVAEGSTFKNGEVTLMFKGLGAVDGAACAIVAYDSGESSFKMVATPTPNMEIRSVGSSHYQGDLYIDLASRWVKKATMYELVVAETKLPMPPHKINAVIEREMLIRNVTEQEFSAK